MGKRVLDFNGYVEKVNEGKLSDTMSKIASSIKDNFQRVKDFIKAGIIKIIPSGPRKGTPTVNYYAQENGSVLSQINNLYKGTEFAKMNPVKALSESMGYSPEVDEAKVPLEYPNPEHEIRDIDAEELIEDLKDLYKDNLKGGRAKPLFIFGAPGIGKTQIVGQVADEFGIDMMELPLQYMSPEDFLGIPSTVTIEEPTFDAGKFVSPGKGGTRYNPPFSLPVNNGKHDKGGILFLDEMNRAKQSVLDTMLKFVQSKKIGDYQLPSKWVIVAAGNRVEDATGSARIAEFDPALADRFTVKNFVPKYEDWARWARTTEKFPEVILNFIETNKDELFHYIDNEKSAINFPTPRSWTDAVLILSDRLDDLGLTSEDWRSIPTEKIYKVFADQIGFTAAGRLKAYLDVMKTFSPTDIKNITEDPEKAPSLKGLKSDVLYGVFELAMKDAEKRNGGKPTLDNLLNAVKYYRINDQIEILSWVYARLGKDYPDLVNITQEVLDNPEDPENALKIKIGEELIKGVKSKGLTKSQMQ